MLLFILPRILPSAKGKAKLGQHFLNKHLVVYCGVQKVVMLVSHVGSQPKYLNSKALILLKLFEHCSRGGVIGVTI